MVLGILAFKLLVSCLIPGLTKFTVASATFLNTIADFAPLRSFSDTAFFYRIIDAAVALDIVSSNPPIMVATSIGFIACTFWNILSSSDSFASISLLMLRSEDIVLPSSARSARSLFPMLLRPLALRVLLTVSCTLRDTKLDSDNSSIVDSAPLFIFLATSLTKLSLLILTPLTDSAFPFRRRGRCYIYFSASATGSPARDNKSSDLDLSPGGISFSISSAGI